MGDNDSSDLELGDFENEEWEDYDGDVMEITKEEQMELEQQQMLNMLNTFAMQGRKMVRCVVYMQTDFDTLCKMIDKDGIKVSLHLLKQYKDDITYFYNYVAKSDENKELMGEDGKKLFINYLRNMFEKYNTDLNNILLEVSGCNGSYFYGDEEKGNNNEKVYVEKQNIDNLRKFLVVAYKEDNFTLIAKYVERDIIAVLV